MDQILSEIVNWYRGEVMTQEKCDELVKEIKKALGEFEEFEKGKDFYSMQPISDEE